MISQTHPLLFWGGVIILTFLASAGGAALAEVRMGKRNRRLQREENLRFKNDFLEAVHETVTTASMEEDEQFLVKFAEVADRFPRSMWVEVDKELDDGQPG